MANQRTGGEMEPNGGVSNRVKKAGEGGAPSSFLEDAGTQVTVRFVVGEAPSVSITKRVNAAGKEISYGEPVEIKKAHRDAIVDVLKAIAEEHGEAIGRKAIMSAADDLAGAIRRGEF